MKVESKRTSLDWRDLDKCNTIDLSRSFIPQVHEYTSDKTIILKLKAQSPCNGIQKPLRGLSMAIKD